MSEGAPVAKRPRRSKDNDKCEVPQREVFLTLWHHWQAYLASTEPQEDDPESTPDTDELMEMLEIGRREKIPVLSPPSAVKEQDTTSFVNFYVEAWKKPWDLIPVLLSIAANVLADDAIALYLS